MAARGSRSRRFRPLADRLVVVVFGVCAACAVLTALVQGWQVWADTERAHHDTVRDITEGRLPMLSTALWDIDGSFVQRQIDEIARRPQVSGVQLLTAGGQRFAAGEPSTGGRPTVDLLIPHPHAGGAPLGRLSVEFNPSYGSHLLTAAMLRTLLGIALLATLTGTLLVRFLQRELSDPLLRIAQWARTFRPGAPGEPLVLVRREREWIDDIDVVADAFKTLQRSIERYARERDDALRRLGQERDHLEAAVRERTADLQRVNAFLARLTQLSAKLIDLPLDRYPQVLRAALADIATALGTGACALAEMSAQGGWHWRFIGGARPHCVHEDDALPPLPQSAWAGQRRSGCEADAASQALSRAVGCSVLLLCWREDGRTGQMLASIGARPGVEERQREEIGFVAEALFGALARWRSLRDLEGARLLLLLQSRKDPLTGLANRREFDERKIEEIRRSRRLGQPVSLLMIDIDHFKRFNDTYGHAAGDDCLVRVARCLQASFLRPSDCVARIGGEEFAILLPGIGAESARRQGQRARAAVERLDIPHSGVERGRVSVSIGVASSLATEGEADALFDRLLRAADKALYAAKAAGRDRVMAEAVLD